ncbi:phosphate signaling complex protein PhoU [Banduia mediterranea]|uniref:phosphate signaling complex protein PhoU n=1 Tax=Banduia mediterranea TaxID=3075609 RepID=UPI003D775D84
MIVVVHQAPSPHTPLLSLADPAEPVEKGVAIFVTVDPDVLTPTFLEVQIDAACTQLLVRRQPTAGDLRFVYAVIKTSTQLERVGDEAAKIARMTVRLWRKRRTREHMFLVMHLSRQVQEMVCDAVRAFADMDVEKAVAVARQDQVVDREYEALMRQLITYMMEDVHKVGPVIDIIFCVRALERIGDHAKSIADDVIYFVRGVDVRHVPLEVLEQRLQLPEGSSQDSS